MSKTTLKIVWGVKLFSIILKLKLFVNKLTFHMQQLPIYPTNKANFNNLLFFLLLFSLFFPIKHIFFTKIAFSTGMYSDFTSFSLYLSFFVLISMLIFNFKSYCAEFTTEQLGIKVLIAWVLLLLLFNLYHFNELTAIYLLKYLTWVVAYGTSVYFGSKFIKIHSFLIVFVALSTAESLLALFQFLYQHSLGLKYLGETILSSNLLGIAKIITNNVVYIRAYGTFPHPNPLAAFVVCGIFCSLALVFYSNTRKQRALYSILTFINLLGLTVTFSRAGFLAFGLGLIIYFVLLWRNNFPKMKIIFSLVLVAVSILSSFLIYKPYLISRAVLLDQSSNERNFYNLAGLKMIRKHPLAGIGIGESLLKLQNYTNNKLLPWQIQPIHNYFLLVAAETGLLSSILLLIFFLIHVKQLWLSIKIKTGELSIFKITLFTILCSFLILMVFDHYFYTLEQTSVLFWVFLGLIKAEIQITPTHNI